MDLIVPAYARGALFALQRVAPEAVIVGGFLRDLAAGVEPKDIDLFCGPIAEGDLARAFGEFSGYSRVYDAETLERYGRGFTRDDVAAIYNVDMPGCPLPIQVISLKEPITPRMAIGRVDFDFCQIAYDGERVITSDGFRAALRHKTACYVLADRTPEEMERSRRRVERWKERRYAEWTFLFPEVDRA